MKPDCYECKYRGNVPGDAHSCCEHPSISVSPLTELIALLGAGGPSVSSSLNIEADPHGIRSGWFCWPINFDPVWLISCDGFKEKDKDDR
jgi:hypothetical protein